MLRYASDAPTTSATHLPQASGGVGACLPPIVRDFCIKIFMPPAGYHLDGLVDQTTSTVVGCHGRGRHSQGGAMDWPSRLVAPLVSILLNGGCGYENHYR